MKRNNISRRMSSAVVAFSVSLLCLTQPFGTSRASAGEHGKPYALIFGTVWGPDDQPIYGVPIKIKRADRKKANWELYSDHRGEFAQRVPAGKNDYIVWAELKHEKGQLALSAPEVKVHIENDERQDIGLHLKKAATQ